MLAKHSNRTKSLSKSFIASSVLGLYVLLAGQCAIFPHSQAQVLQLGRDIALNTCSGCHLFPEPGLLDKHSWEQVVLPRMAAMLGYHKADKTIDSQLFAGVNRTDLHPRVMREKSNITEAEWNVLVNYYLTHAPDSLPQEVQHTPELSEASYQVQKLDLFLSPPATTLVRSIGGAIYFSDAHKKQLYQYDPQSGDTRATPVGEGAVDLDTLSTHTLLITCMGSFSPTDAALGCVLQMDARTGQTKTMIDSLRRPVHTSVADFDGNQLPDLLISEYGKWAGRLSLHLQQKSGLYKKSIVFDMPGAIASIPLNLNQDSLPDMLVLFGQGDEKIMAFHNLGGGKFEPEVLISFPPTYGSSSFDTIDYNNDGHFDIMFTCGDGADYHGPEKPYHGIRVFINDQHNQFTEQLFLPMPGAYKALFTDFDADGNQDILAISYFPKCSEERIVNCMLFEKKNSSDFLPRSIPIGHINRWMLLEPIKNQFGKDIAYLLGGLVMEFPTKPEMVKVWSEKGLPFIILKPNHK
jgi:hypothetical protein